jgi:hypothetical protein
MRQSKLNECGLFSLDFVVGISIFMIAFIVVATMTSSLLVGLQSRTIDYDAVAYRTGVVLAEDPGEIEETVGISYIAPDRYAWDLIYSPEYWDQYSESNIMRMGLMIPRYYYDTPPRVLMAHKVTTFFNLPKDRKFYQDKVIFGDYPYHFNITLTLQDGTILSTSNDDPVPSNTSTGYVRRLVMIKSPTWLNITNISKEDLSGSVTVTYDFRNISVGDPAYMIYPSLEPTIINLTSFPGPATYTLKYLQVCSPTCEDPETGPPSIVLKNYESGLEHRFPDIGLGMTEIPLNNSSYLEIEPGYLTRRYFPNLGPIDSIDIKMLINSSDPATTQKIGGSYEYHYTYISGAEFYSPPLAPAVLEVRIW